MAVVEASIGKIVPDISLKTFCCSAGRENPIYRSPC